MLRTSEKIMLVSLRTSVGTFYIEPIEGSNRSAKDFFLIMLALIKILKPHQFRSDPIG